MSQTPEEFVTRWAASGGSERANYALFLTELCELLDVPRPNVAKAGGHGTYVFEREVKEVFTDGKSTSRFIDFYRQGSFVLETKQGVEKEENAEGKAKESTKKKGHGVRGTAGYDTSMVKAKAQAEAYVRFLPADEGRPPFVLVVDVGSVGDNFTFSRSWRAKSLD